MYLVISTANLRLALKKGKQQSIADGMGYVHVNSSSSNLKQKGITTMYHPDTVMFMVYNMETVEMIQIFYSFIHSRIADLL